MYGERVADDTAYGPHTAMMFGYGHSASTQACDNHENLRIALGSSVDRLQIVLLPLRPFLSSEGHGEAAGGVEGVDGAGVGVVGLGRDGVAEIPRQAGAAVGALRDDTGGAEQRGVAAFAAKSRGVIAWHEKSFHSSQKSYVPQEELPPGVGALAQHLRLTVICSGTSGIKHTYT